MVTPSDHQTPEEVKRRLQAIGQLAQASFAQTHEVREQALRLSREATRNSANSIRATHRGEFERAQQLLDEVAALAKRIDALLKDHPWVSTTPGTLKTRSRSMPRPARPSRSHGGLEWPAPGSLGSGRPRT